jgi:hypothetical protein
MAGVGGIACSLVRPVNVRLMQEHGETWHVNGVDGVGSMKLGAVGGPFEFECVYYAANAAAAHVWHASLRDLMWTSVSIVDDWGTTHTYALLKELGPLIEIARINHDGNGTCRAATIVTGEFIA